MNVGGRGEVCQRQPAIAAQVAVAHRHNYIGTEHVSLGVAAEPNAATRPLTAPHVLVGQIRADIEKACGATLLEL